MQAEPETNSFSIGDNFDQAQVAGNGIYSHTFPNEFVGHQNFKSCAFLRLLDKHVPRFWNFVLKEFQNRSRGEGEERFGDYILNGDLGADQEEGIGGRVQFQPTGNAVLFKAQFPICEFQFDVLDIGQEGVDVFGWDADGDHTIIVAQPEGIVKRSRE